MRFARRVEGRRSPTRKTGLLEKLEHVGAPHFVDDAMHGPRRVRWARPQPGAVVNEERLVQGAYAYRRLAGDEPRRHGPGAAAVGEAPGAGATIHRGQVHGEAPHGLRKRG